MAIRLVERHLLDGVSRNLGAAQDVAVSFGWPWLVTAVETVRFEQELHQEARASPASAATLPPSTVPSRTTSKATTEAEVSLSPLRIFRTSLIRFSSSRTMTIATRRLPLDPNHAPSGSGSLLRTKRATSLPPLARRPRASRARCRRHRCSSRRRTRRKKMPPPLLRGPRAKAQVPKLATRRPNRRMWRRPTRSPRPRAPALLGAVVVVEAHPAVERRPQRVVQRKRRPPRLRSRGQLPTSRFQR